ncbi:B3 domain-containing transcription factor VRN1-like [Mercurialis annua]|uniref:B3 domain-containing transcription factor VRN1-like n=1 Tax=Mercurialis annua TaxID=3986 RepID=UPI0024ACC910|nr:B3 domain-containing transcription factor VRN1-like [Mercurialis annua]
MEYEESVGIRNHYDQNNESLPVPVPAKKNTNAFKKAAASEVLETYRPTLHSKEKAGMHKLTLVIYISIVFTVINSKTLIKLKHYIQMLPSFTRSFGKEFRSNKFATLSFPNGFSVRVRLTKKDNKRACLDIAKLVELGYLHKGFILGFTYKGFSFFKVAVFDPSQAFLQIEYPCNVTKSNKQRFSHKQTRFCNNEETDDDQETESDNDDDQETTDDDDDDDDSDRETTSDDDGGDDEDQETTDDDKEDRKESLKRKNKFKSSMHQRSNKDGKRVDARDDYRSPNMTSNRKKSQKKCKIEEEETDSDENESSASETESEIVVTKNFASIYRNLSPESKRAVKAAKKCKPTSPAFMAVLTSQTIRALYIPAAFSDKYLRAISREDVKIQKSYGKERQKEWLVRALRRDYGMIFTEGWGRFSKDNSLSLGDVCVFELIDSKNFVFKASIFDA